MNDNVTFVPSDWLAATARLSPAARGVWITSIATMVHNNLGGVLCVSWTDLARLCGCGAGEVYRYVVELGEAGICKVEPWPVPRGQVDINENVKLLSIGLMKRAKSREYHKLYKRQQRGVKNV